MVLCFSTSEGSLTSDTIDDLLAVGMGYGGVYPYIMVTGDQCLLHVIDMFTINRQSLIKNLCYMKPFHFQQMVVILTSDSVRYSEWMGG